MITTKKPTNCSSYSKINSSFISAEIFCGIRKGIWPSTFQASVS